LVEGTLVWHRTEHIDSIRKRNRDVYGPYFSEKEVRQFAESTDEPLQILRDHEKRKDSFVLKCQIRPITIVDGVSWEDVTAFLQASFANFPIIKYLVKGYKGNITIEKGKLTTGAGLVAGGVGMSFTQLGGYTVAGGVGTYMTMTQVGAIAAGAAGAGLAGFVIGALIGSKWAQSWIKWPLARKALEFKRRAEGGEEPSAETPVKEEVFDLAAFSVDTTASACEVVRQNAYLAAQAYEQT
jgi:hypothetical protein